MTSAQHHALAMGLLAYASRAEDLDRHKVAARLREEAQAHVLLSGGAAAERYGSRMPAGAA